MASKHELEELFNELSNFRRRIKRLITLSDAVVFEAKFPEINSRQSGSSNESNTFQNDVIRKGNADRLILTGHQKKTLTKVQFVSSLQQIDSFMNNVRIKPEEKYIEFLSNFPKEDIFVDEKPLAPSGNDENKMTASLNDDMLLIILYNFTLFVAIASILMFSYLFFPIAYKYFQRANLFGSRSCSTNY